MANNYFLMQYDKEITKGNTSSLCEYVLSENNLTEIKISEFAKKGLYYHSIAENYFIDNIIEIGEIRKKCQCSENVIFCRNTNLPMGYFCSSPIFDLVIGRTKRGKLYKKSLRSNFDMKYYFDKDRLIYTEYNHCDDEIFLFYNELQKTVYEFMLNQNRLMNLTVCKYDCENRITERTIFSHKKTSQDSIEKDIFGVYLGNRPIVIRDMEKNTDYLFTIDEEIFTYKSGRISEAIESKFFSFMPNFLCHKYIFRYDGDFYCDYDFINCYTGNKSTYGVDTKRKFFEFISPPAYSSYVK